MMDKFDKVSLAKHIRFSVCAGRVVFSCMGVELSYDENSEIGYFLKNYIVGNADYELVYALYWLDVLGVWRLDLPYIEGIRGLVDGLYGRNEREPLSEVEDLSVLNELRSDFLGADGEEG